MSVPDPDQPAPHYLGHRSRLRDRLLADSDGLQDYELVEYLLGLTIRRQDTKELAKRLLVEFDGINGLMTAKPDALMAVKGMGDVSAAGIKVVQAVAHRMLRVEASERPMLANWQALLDYLRADMAYAGVERVRVLHLDGRNRLIRDEKISEGTIDESAVHVREVVRRAMELNASAIILVHNHPSGDPQPSRADIELTRTIAEAGRRLGISVHDHIIIGRNGHASLRAMGLL